MRKRETVLVGCADFLFRHAVEDRRRSRVDADVGIDPDDALAVLELGRAQNEALLPGGTPALRARTRVKRVIEDEEVEIVPAAILGPTGAAMPFEALEILRADRKRDDRGLRRYHFTMPM